MSVNGGRRELLADAALVTALTGVGLLELATARELGFSLVTVALLLGSTVPLALRRRRPVLTYLVIGAAVWLPLLAGRTQDAPAGSLAFAVALYSAAAYTDRRISLAVLAATVGALLLYLLRHDGVSGADVAWLALPVLVLWVLGDGVRLRAARLEQAHRDADTEREARLRQAARADRAVLQERTRIARELHDVIAHHVSLIVVHTETAPYLLDQGRDAALAGYAGVGDAARRALQEMDRMLGLLRPDGEVESAPQPGLSDLDALLESIRSAGVPVGTAQVSGEPRKLWASLDLSAYRIVQEAYRIVQEALTNIVKHAPGATAWVRVHYGEVELVVTVTDDGPGADHAALSSGGGHGLIGMRERAALFGGRLTAGDHQPRGFEVIASLPYPRGVT